MKYKKKGRFWRVPTFLARTYPWGPHGIPNKERRDMSGDQKDSVLTY